MSTCPAPDSASLQTQGAAIEGEPGIGYSMNPCFMLPPLMLGSEELDALLLGMRLVAEQGDRSLPHGAMNTLAKIASVLPPELRRELEASTLRIGAGGKIAHHAADADLLRATIRTGRKLGIAYRDPAGTLPQRVVRPYALVYFDLTRILMCWCERRGAFRNFRIDRISAIDVLEARAPKNRQLLLSEWRRSEYVPGRSILPETDRPGGGR